MNRAIKINNLRQDLMISLTLSQKKANKHIILQQIIQLHSTSSHMIKSMKIVLKTMAVLPMIHIRHSRLTLSRKMNQITILINTANTTIPIIRTKVIPIIKAMIINPEVFPLQILSLIVNHTNIIIHLQIQTKQQAYLVQAIREYLRRKRIMWKFMKIKPISLTHSVKR